MACYFLALLSKEWGITLVVMIPVALYVFKEQATEKVISAGLPFLGVAVVYMMLRVHFVGLGGGVGSKELLNNPYLNATGAQKVATKMFVLGKYLYYFLFRLCFPQIIRSTQYITVLFLIGMPYFRSLYM